MYPPRNTSACCIIFVRGLRYNLRIWGSAAAPPLILLHGGWDASPTFQFMVDCFRHDWRIVAPDWRGHGRSEHAPQGYWLPDYAADLDALLDQLFPGRPVPIVGHSLGGNVGCYYAGLRPGRVARLVSLDGFGLPSRDPRDAPLQLRRWLDSWREAPRPHRIYASVAEMAARLCHANPRLSLDKALFLASGLSEEAPGGKGYCWAFDPRHRSPFATLHRHAEWEACMAEIRAPVLFIGSGKPFPPALENEPGGLAGRVACVPGARFERVEGAGHNLHHDEPEAVARMVEDFLLG